MDKMRSLFRLSKAEGSHSFNNVIVATSSRRQHINNPRRDQYIATIYTSPSTPLTPVDNLSTHFTGRKRELALIAKAFTKRRKIPLRCALFGKQDVGKSQLTYSWAKSTFAANENAYIMWISATTVEKIYQGFCRLLRFVDHPHQSHPDQNARLDAARRWLEEVNTGNWLLVFDNVFPETVDFLRQHLPRINSRGTILFTIRTKEVAIAVTSTAGERHRVIEVPLLSVEEGIELFCGHFDTGKMDPSSAKVEAIVRAVGCLPLAISHAAAYVNQFKSSLDDMLELYQSKHKIEAIRWEHTHSHYEHKSVAATFSSQLEDLDRQFPDASKLLRVIAFLDPECIPLKMLITGAKAIIEGQWPPTQSPFTQPLLQLILSPVARQNAITQLRNRCLVAYQISSTSPTFRIHDLIQLVIIENTRSSGLDQQLFELAVELVCAAFWKIANPESPKWWPRCELLIPHIQSLTMRQDTSKQAKKTLLLANNRRGLYLSNRGRYLEAESLYEMVIAEREQLFRPNDLDTLTVMHNLARVYRSRGRYVDADALCHRVLESKRTQLGPEHRGTLATMYHLADVYRDQGRYDDAETLLKHTVQIQESQFGSEDKHTLSTMNMLATVYRSQNRYDEAESLLTRVLHAREKRGPEHLSTLYTKHSLANVYTSQRHYDAAAALFQQVLHAREKHLGSQHPDTLTTMSALAGVYISQGRNAEAEKLLVHVFASRDRVYGLSHPRTQRTVNKLLSVYEALGRVDEARTLKERISSASS